MTDMEGVCGVKNAFDWVFPNGAHYEKGKKLLTGEVNAAIDGLFAGGATEVWVADGHGCGGIAPAMMDARAKLLTREQYGEKGYPFCMDNSFDCFAFVGQHARVGTRFAHLPHSSSHDVLSNSINGIQLGECGTLCCLAEKYAMPCIFGSGDTAFAQELNGYCPNARTVAVKTGKCGDLPEDSAKLLGADYFARFSDANHLMVGKALKLIRAESEQAMRDFVQTREKFFYTGLPKAPYYHLTEYRKTEQAPAAAYISTHPTDFLELMLLPMSFAYSVTDRGYMNTAEYEAYLQAKKERK